MSLPSRGLPPDMWAGADAYERYIGRWSRLVAREFVAWLAVPSGAHWVDVGCGTGALSASIVALARPATVLGVDPSAAFVAKARTVLAGPGVRFEVGEGAALPVGDGSQDAVVAGLVLNFLPDPAAALADWRRAARQGSVIGAYVWDYAEGMQLLRRFFDAAVALDPAARALDEGERFQIARQDALAAAFVDAGLEAVATRAVEVATRFADFDDLWQPFLGGQGPAPAYVASLAPDRRDALRERLRATLPTGPNGAIELVARAWAVRGTNP